MVAVPSSLHAQERCFPDSVVVQMAKDLQELDALREYVSLLEEMLQKETEAYQASVAREEKAIEIAREYKDLGKPSFLDTVKFGSLFFVLGAIGWELARD